MPGSVTAVAGQVSTATPGPKGSARNGAPSPQSGFRPDLEGLRAVAVLLVVIYHANLGLLTGGYVGVDVFYVLSGFFITGLMLREADRTGRVSLASFYARRGRRLIPVATLVVLVTLAGSWLMCPPVRQTSIGMDGLAATMNVANAWFQAASTNYLQLGAAPSPFLHFWSLAVEEQFYWVWPVLFTCAAALAAGRAPNRRRLLWTVGVLSVASLAGAVLLTQTSQTAAFFSLPTRLWELGAGAMLAACSVRLGRLPRHVKDAALVLGIASIAASAFMFNEQTAFPGWAAIVPVAGAGLVIAGSRTPVGGPGSLLAVRPLRAVGRWSYSIYLWHWPLLVLPAAAAERALDWPVRVALAALSIGCGAASYRWVENPLRRNPWLSTSNRRSLALTFTLIVTSVIASVVLIVFPRPIMYGPPAAAPQAGMRQGELEQALTTLRIPSNLEPGLRIASLEEQSGTKEGCHLGIPGSTFNDCIFGDTSGGITVMLLGDSHAAHWLPALDSLGKAHGWRIIMLAKGGCADTEFVVQHPSDTGRRYTECAQARKTIVSRVAAEHPEVVLLSSRVPFQTEMPPPERQQWLDGVPQYISDMRAAGARHVVWIGDTPHPTTFVPDCLSAHSDSIVRCLPARSDATSAETETAVQAAVGSAGAAYVPTTDWLCTPTRCPLIVGNILIYRDDSHLTKPAALWLASALETALVPLIEG